ncbi:MAG: right-handed parallel beta-helix repeat-containing protein [Anaerolineae bacterium]
MSRIIGARRSGALAAVALLALVATLAAVGSIDTVPVRAAAPLAPMQQTEVDGSIVTDTVWSAAGSPYHVVGSTTVREGVTLTIESGVTVEFAETASLRVQGALYVNGSSPDDVVFTSDKTEKAAGDWPSLEIDTVGRAVIHGATIQYAGRGNRHALRLEDGNISVDQVLIERALAAGILVDGLSAVIQNTTVRECGGEAIRIDGPNGDDPPNVVNLTNLTIVDNGSEAVVADADAHLVVSGTTANGNGINGIYISGGKTQGETTWTGGDLPYVVNSGLVVGSDMTIGSNTVVKFTSSGSMRVDGGTLTVDGAADGKVYFTSLADDDACTSTAVDCDTNNDGSETTPARGSWDKLNLDDATGPVTIKHAVLRYGKGPIVRVKTENVTLEDIDVFMVTGDGVEIDTVDTAISDSQIRGAEDAGLVIDTESTRPLTIALTDNRFCENGIAVQIKDPNVDLQNSGNTTRCETESGTTEYTNGVNGYDIYGNMEGPQTWRAADMPFVVRKRLELAQTAAVLTLEPGLLVKLDGQGTIIAERGQLRSGEPGGDRVLITSLRDDSCTADEDAPTDCDTNGDGDRDTPAAGDWYNVSIRRGAAGAILHDTVIRYGGDESSSEAQLDIQNSNSIVEDCEVAYGKKDGIRVYQTDTTLVGNTVRDNERHGIRLVGGSVAIVVDLSRNTISGNKEHAIDADANVEVVLDGTNVVEANGRNGIVLHGDSRVSRTWRNGALAFILSDDVDVIGLSTLTIEPGVVVKLENGAVLSARDGKLIAEGGNQPSERIVFTSVADDTHKGNSNPNDGDIFPKPGDWGGIDFESSGQGGSLMNVDVFYAGSGNTPALTIAHEQVAVEGVLLQDGGSTGVLVEDVNASLEGLVIKNMHGTGISLETEESIEPTVKDNEITGCGAAVVMDGNVEPQLGGNVAEDNTINGIVVKGSIDVTRNWQAGDLVFVIDDVIPVGQSAMLRIEAGAVVKSQLDSYLVVRRGGLEIPKADSGDAMVTMTSIRDDTCGAGVSGECDTNNDGDNTVPRPGDWRGVKIENGVRSVVIDGLWIDHAGSLEAAIEIERDLVEVLNSVIIRSGTHGILIDDVSAVIRNNLFADNVEYGLKLRHAASAEVEGNVFTGNSRPVEHRADGLTTMENNVAIGNVDDAMLYCADVTQAQTWPNDLVREVDCKVTVLDGLLKIEPGAVLLFNGTSSGIDVESELHVEGVTMSGAGDAPVPGSWGRILFDENSRGGYVRHSQLMYGASDESMIESQTASSVEITFNTFRRASEGVIKLGEQVASKVSGNVIRDVNDDKGSGIAVVGAGSQRELTYNRIANVVTGIVTSRDATPLIRQNSLEGTGTGVENKSSHDICVDAQHNWWGATSGPWDEDKTLDACRLEDNKGQGVSVTNDVNYMQWLETAPPQVPMIRTPRCGVTSDSQPRATGSTSPHVNVNVYDGNSATPGVPIATGESNERGEFEIELDLSAGEHRLSLEAVSGERRSPVSGFRIIEVADTDVDPAGIRFEYGTGSGNRVQPLRDVSGCSTACGGPTSGRVKVPADADVRVIAPIDGSPSTVEFVQAGQAPQAMRYDGSIGAYATGWFKPVSGSFTIKVDGDQGDQCLGYVYLGRESVVFFDSGATGDPAETPSGDPFVFDFESGSTGWVPGHPWALIDDPNHSHSKTHAWHDSPGGTYPPDSDLELRAPGPIDLRTVTAPQLTFWHYFRLANDRAMVEISLDGGETWTELIRFTGTIGQWQSEVVSLEEYAREPRVWLRFRLRSGSSQEDDGWYIDDVSITPGGALNGRYDKGEPLVSGAEVELERHNVDTGEWLRWRGTITGQQNPQTTGDPGSYGFYYLEPGEYRVTVVKQAQGVHRSPPQIVWDGVFEYDVPMTGGLPSYLPVVLKNRRLQ